MARNFLLKSTNQFYKLALIQIPIRDLKNFCQTYPKKLKAQLEQIKSSLVPSKLVSEDDLEDYFRQIFRSLRPQDLDIWFRYLFSDLLESVDHLERLCQNLLTASNVGFKYDYFSYLIHRLKFIQEKLLQLIERVKSELENDQYHQERYQYYLEYPEENIDQGKIYFALINLPDSLGKISYELEYYLKALEEKFRVFASNYSGREDVPPAAEQAEVLYHATINADKIAASGFHRGEAKMEGIGGSSETRSGKKSISFTSDLYIAKEIARCLKEAIMIANGEIDGNDVLEWAENPETVLRSYRGIYGESDFSSPKEIFNLYRTYLAYSNRYDPLFVHTADKFINAFRGRSPQEVGIIAAKVDMSNQDISYSQAMLEYRVPAEAVIAIEKVIK